LRRTSLSKSVPTKLDDLTLFLSVKQELFEKFGSIGPVEPTLGWVSVFYVIGTTTDFRRLTVVLRVVFNAVCVVFDSEQSPWEVSFTKHSFFLTGFWKNFFVLKTVFGFNEDLALSE
jgi:hypothetical protein